MAEHKALNNQEDIKALKDFIKKDIINFEDNPELEERHIKYYKNILNGTVDSLNNMIESYNKDANWERGMIDNYDNTAPYLEMLANQVLIIKDLKINNNTEVIKEFLAIINNPKIVQKDNSVNALKSLIKSDNYGHHPEWQGEITTARYYKSLLNDTVDILEVAIETKRKEIAEQRKNKWSDAYFIDKLMKEIIIIRDLKVNNETEILKEFHTIINDKIKNNPLIIQKSNSINALKNLIENDDYDHHPKLQREITIARYYKNLLNNPVDIIEVAIETLKKEIAEQRKELELKKEDDIHFSDYMPLFNHYDGNKELMNEMILISYLKVNNETEILKEFHTIINNKLKAETPLTEAQEVLKDQYLKTIEYLGFNPAYHEPNIIKAIKEGNLSFSTNDLAKDNKNIKYELTFSLNNVGNGKVSYKAENWINGYKVVWPQLGVPIPKKEMTEGLLTGGFILTDLLKENGEKYKVWMGIDKKNPPLTWEKGNRLFDKDNKCVNTHSGEFKVPVRYFAHEMTKKDVATLLNGKGIDIYPVDFKTGQKLLLSDFRVDFNATPEGKTKLDFSYSEMEGGVEFISQYEVQYIKDRIKQSKGEPAKSLTANEAQQEIQVKEKTKITERVSDDSFDDDSKKKNRQSKLGA